MHLIKRSLFGPDTYSMFLNSSELHDAQQTHLGWNYPIELQHLIHEHWRGFPVPKIYYNFLFFSCYFVLMFSSIFGNGLVIWIFSTSKNLRTPSNLLIINLAVFDLLMCTNMPHYLLNSIVGYFVGGDLGCDIYALNGGISGMGAAISNAFIAYDRFRTISNPIDGRLNYVQISVLILVSWLWTVPFSFLPFSRLWGRFIPEGYLTTCSFDYLTDNDDTRYFVWFIFAWAYCIPMSVIVSNYTRLFLHVRDHERMLAEQAKKMNVKSLSANQNTAAMSVEIRIAKAAMLIFMLFVFSWTPYATVTLLSTFGYQELITPFVSMLPASAAKAVSCLDPWVYAASHPKYRLELERRLPWLGIREKSSAASSSNSGEGGGGKDRAGGSEVGEAASTLSMDAMS